MLRVNTKDVYPNMAAMVNTTSHHPTTSAHVQHVVRALGAEAA